MPENRCIESRKVYVTNHEYPVIGRDDDGREVIEYRNKKGVLESYAIHGFLDPREVITRTVGGMRYFFDTNNGLPISRGEDLEKKLKREAIVGLRIIATSSNLGRTVSLFDAGSTQELFTSPIREIR